MMWEDMGIYWAWRGGPEGYCKPPYEIETVIVLNEYGQSIRIRKPGTEKPKGFKRG